MNLSKLVRSKAGKIVISVILGLGLASLFRKNCSEKNCLVFVPPEIDELKGNIYGYNNKCYKYQENARSCGKSKINVSY